MRKSGHCFPRPLLYRADPPRSLPAATMPVDSRQAASRCHLRPQRRPHRAPSQSPLARRMELTTNSGAHYSVAMDAELDSLDAKIALLVQLCQQLRHDNTDLRQQLASAQSENRQLYDRIAAAKLRLEALLERIPEDVR